MYLLKLIGIGNWRTFKEGHFFYIDFGLSMRTQTFAVVLAVNLKLNDCCYLHNCH